MYSSRGFKLLGIIADLENVLTDTVLCNHYWADAGTGESAVPISVPIDYSHSRARNEKAYSVMCDRHIASDAFD